MRCELKENTNVTQLDWPVLHNQHLAHDSVSVLTENDECRQAEWEPTAEEKAMLREEFLSQMHQRFLDGKDKDFNYRLIVY